ncbi:hypothetical protein KIN20_034807 [Parelaphostrongylus tenuis]|uniref:Ubiquitin-like domain-containing protein n=1 Tax=Parelaphostrongylus tenuis TaxID=148309 RepID=A0AAD5RD70_PARTN|nr:hypothetical protein KIN20_034807 [Parelaphostrongylus tenuis]
MNGDVAEAAKNYSSDSDDDLYTRSIDIKKLRTIVSDRNSLPDSTSLHQLGRKEQSVELPTKPDIIVLDEDDDSDLLNLSGDENTSIKNSKKMRKRRLKRMEQSKVSEFEEISDPSVDVVILRAKKSKRHQSEECDISEIVILDETTLSTREEDTIREDSLETEVIELEKEVNLFVTVSTDQKIVKPGRLMTIRQDEPFDSLRGIFANELKCNQLDVYIHVNNVDAGPGDTPDSMGLDISKLAMVKVFCIKSSSGLVEDLSTNPGFIPVKCIFAVGKPRCAYISFGQSFSYNPASFPFVRYFSHFQEESIYDAKDRIRTQLKLAGTISKLVFDNEVLSDEETPQSIGIEAEDIIEVHFMP